MAVVNGKVMDQRRGTGNGGSIVGRKVFSFVIYVALLTGFAYFMTKIGAPDSIVVQGMWMVTYVGIFVVGGQALIDTLVPILMRWADAYATAKTGKGMASMEAKKTGGK